jgi:SAM-dependent methyltransferase
MIDATMMEEPTVGMSSRWPECPLCKSMAFSDFLTAPDRFHLRPQQYQLKRCRTCSCVWLSNPPAPEEMPFHYGADYYKSVASAGETSAARRWSKQREVIAGFRQSGDILDIGCSSGGFLSTLKGGSWRLHGIEIAPQMAERARLNTGAEVFVGDALSAPFRPESFDVVTCFDVLEHVYQPKSLLEAVFKWLKPGGMFYTTLPNIDSWEARIFGSFWYGLELPRHLFHFSPQSLTYVLGTVGFKKAHIETQTSYLESSTGYAYGEIRQKLGLPVRSLAKAVRPTIVWRVVRKLLRLSLIVPFGQLASSAGAAASIDAVFVKPPDQH